MRKLWPPLWSVVAFSTLAGCGGASTTVTETQPSSSSTASPSASVARASSSTASTSTTTGSAAPGRCASAGLVGSFLGQQGATGHGELGFALRNVSAHSCHTTGYPGVLFLTAAGTPLPTASTRTTHDFFGIAPVVSLTVPPGTSVSFRLGVTHGVVPGSHCRTAAALQVIPPDDTHTLRVPIPGGAYECGTATVSPLRAGASALR